MDSIATDRVSRINRCARESSLSSPGNNPDRSMLGWDNHVPTAWRTNNCQGPVQALKLGTPWYDTRRIRDKESGRCWQFTRPSHLRLVLERGCRCQLGCSHTEFLANRQLRGPESWLCMAWVNALGLLILSLVIKEGCAPTMLGHQTFDVDFTPATSSFSRSHHGFYVPLARRSWKHTAANGMGWFRYVAYHRTRWRYYRTRIFLRRWWACARLARLWYPWQWPIFRSQRAFVKASTWRRGEIDEQQTPSTTW